MVINRSKKYISELNQHRKSYYYDSENITDNSINISSIFNKNLLENDNSL